MTFCRIWLGFFEWKQKKKKNGEISLTYQANSQLTYSKCLDLLQDQFQEPQLYHQDV